MTRIRSFSLMPDRRRFGDFIRPDAAQRAAGVARRYTRSRSAGRRPADQAEPGPAQPVARTDAVRTGAAIAVVRRLRARDATGKTAAGTSSARLRSRPVRLPMACRRKLTSRAGTFVTVR